MGLHITQQLKKKPCIERIHNGEQLEEYPDDYPLPSGLFFGFVSGVVVIRHVPATVCSQCGMEYIDDKIVEKIESLVNDAREKHSEVEVLSLSA